MADGCGVSNLASIRDEIAAKYAGDPRYSETLDIVLAAIDRRINQCNETTITTCGTYSSEAEAEKAFDRLVNPDFFKIEKEVRGRRLFDDKAKKNDEPQIIRIDRLLIPTELAVKSGYHYGPIAVEIKKSGVAVGGVFAQVIEYRQSVFLSSILGNARIMPLIFAVFPTNGITGDMHSLQRTQHIVSCWVRNGSLRFGIYGGHLFDLGPDGISEIGSWKISVKKGHRGLEK